jgi:hypothetical protein
MHILGFLRTPSHHVPLGVVGPTSVDVDYGVTSVNPLRRVNTLKIVKSRQRSWVDAAVVGSGCVTVVESGIGRG